MLNSCCLVLVNLGCCCLLVYSCRKTSLKYMSCGISYKILGVLVMTMHHLIASRSLDEFEIRGRYKVGLKKLFDCS